VEKMEKLEGERKIRTLTAARSNAYLREGEWELSAPRMVTETSEVCKNVA